MTTQLRRLRISRVGAKIHDQLQEIGEPVAFAQRLAHPQPLRGLPVGLPFAEDLPTDLTFWSRIAERKLQLPVPENIAPKLRRAGVPLRYRASLSTAARAPRLEAHLHPFGVAALTTVDLEWDQPVSLEQARQSLDQLEATPATVTVGDVNADTTLQDAATACAETLVQLLSDPGQGQAWELPGHRLVTVISGVVEEPLTEMPAPHSPLHLALHRLSAGDQAVADPATAFVAQWTGAGYAWPTTSMLYMLSRGTALLAAEAAADERPSNAPTAADRHRQLLLLIAYITASAGLVRAAQSSGSNLIQEWGRTAAKRLGLLFGPGQDFLDWGQVPQALLLRTGAVEPVAQLRGEPLTSNPHYPVPDYG